MTLSHNHKYAHLFLEQESDPYLFVSRLGDGCFSHAQLVWHIPSQQLRVRKVPHRRLKQPYRPDTDVELKVFNHLSMASPIPDINPRIAKLISQSNIRRIPQYPGDPIKWTPVSYWEYYNGGELGDFLNDSGTNLSLTVVARFLHQILQSLEFCYKAGVIHQDLNSGNIWIHWENGDESKGALPDFYLGDFGLSTILDERKAASPPLPALQAWANKLNWDIPRLITHVHTMLSNKVRGVGGNLDEALKHAGPIAPVIRELQDLDNKGASGPNRDGKATRPPSLSKAIQLAGEAAAHFLALDGGRVNYRALHSKPAEKARNPNHSPLYYRDAEDMLFSRLIPGPWYIAHVNVKERKLAGYFDKPHTRPNVRIPDSDTEDEIDTSKSRAAMDPSGPGFVMVSGDVSTPEGFSELGSYCAVVWSHGSTTSKKGLLEKESEE